MFRNQICSCLNSDCLRIAIELVVLRYGLLTRYVKLWLRMHRECLERFPRHRGLAIPVCITARAWPLFDKKPTSFSSDGGHVCALMHAGIAN